MGKSLWENSCADEHTDLCTDGKSAIIIYYCSFIFKLQHLNAIICNAHQGRKEQTSAYRDGKRTTMRLI